MSKFTQTVAQFSQLSDLVASFLRNAPHVSLQANHAALLPLQTQLEQLAPSIERYHENAVKGTQDPNKRLYGPAMVENIEKLYQSYMVMVKEDSEFVQVRDRIMKDWEVCEQEKRQREKEDEIKKRQEQERIHKEEEEVRRKQVEDQERQAKEMELQIKIEQERQEKKAQLLRARRIQYEENKKAKKATWTEKADREDAEKKNSSSIDLDSSSSTSLQLPKNGTGPSFSITVKTTKDGTFTVDALHANYTVYDLKLAIQKHSLGLPLEQQRLILHGRMMDDKKSLAEYQLAAGSAIYMVQKPVGGKQAMDTDPVAPRAAQGASGKENTASETAEPMQISKTDAATLSTKTTTTATTTTTTAAAATSPALASASALAASDQSSSSPRTIQLVTIKTVNGQTFKIGPVDRATNVASLKIAVHAATGVPSNRQRLIYAGKILEDAMTLESYNIVNHSTIHMIDKEPGTAAPGSAPASVPAPAAPGPAKATSSAQAQVGAWPTPGKVVSLSNGQDQLKEILTACAPSDRLVVVDWNAPWCGPCHMIAPKFEELAAQYTDVTFVSINVEATPQNKEFFTKAQITALPTFHYYVNNNRVHEFRGAVPQKIEDGIKQFRASGATAATSPSASTSSSASANTSTTPTPTGNRNIDSIPPEGHVFSLTSGGDQLRSILSACASGNRLAVVDWNAPWCGPCRMIAPKFEEMAAKHPSVTFISINTEASTLNKSLSQQAMITALPTFHFYKNSQRVEEVRGANLAAIEQGIARHKTSGTAVDTGTSASASSGGDMTKRVFDAMMTLRQSCGTNLEDFQAGVKTLLTFIRNIVENPGDDKYRKIRTSNKTFQERLGSKSGGLDCMKAFGFTETVIDGEAYLVMSSADASKAELFQVKNQLEQATGLGLGPTTLTATATTMTTTETGTEMGTTGTDPDRMETAVAGNGMTEEEEEEERLMQEAIRLSLEEEQKKKEEDS